MADRDARKLIVRRFCPADQDAARALILAGLEEHWGWLDPTKNPDLADISVAYADETFLVAHLDGELAGTGALIYECEGVGRVVRMSVAHDRRRQGIASAILTRLLEEAKARGFTQVVLETTSTWEDAKCFYLKHGFLPVAERDGETHFSLALA